MVHSGPAAATMLESLRQFKALWDLFQRMTAPGIHVSDQLLVAHQLVGALAMKVRALDEEHARQFPHRACEACQKGLHQACTRCGIGAVDATSNARCACHGGRVATSPQDAAAWPSLG